MKNNPYIGPRPYGRGEGNFFGREREGKELAWLILAERAVLFYAQSGAGKTSLLNARVIPILEKKGVLVLPVARVGSGLPASIDPNQVDNIFVYSALMGLAAETDTPPEALLGHSLLSFLRELGTLGTRYKEPGNGASHSLTDFQPPVPSALVPSPQSPALLIFDQFEEIATTHREHWDKAEGFFRQVRKAIDALPGLGVLFVLREDYVAELDPYTPLLPSHLQARFRMTLPTRQQAMQIVMGPAEKAGCPFAEEAAHNLVANLSRIKTAPPLSSPPPAGGTEGGNIGQYVEPVQLQVVCQQLWESLPEAAGEDHLITWDEIKHYDVDQALTNFYENTLVQTCQVLKNLTGLQSVTERRLRRWFSEALITPEGRRGLALQGAEETAGLPNAAVKALENHHLIRAEVRGGSRWYELSHDRLVEPIVRSNQAWEAAQDQTHPWRPIARQWQAAKSETLLYRGKELQVAQAWLDMANAGEVEPYEKEFIEASQQAEQTRQETYKRRRTLATAFAIVGILMTVLALVAVWQWQAAVKSEQRAKESAAVAEAASTRAIAAQTAAEAASTRAVEEQIRAQAAEADARRQARLALSRQLATEAIIQLDKSNYDLGLLLAIESARHEKTAQAFNALRQALAYPGRVLFILAENTRPIQQAAWNKDNSRLLTFDPVDTARVWDAHTGQLVLTLRGHSTIQQATWNNDGNQILTASDDGTARVWDAQTGDTLVTLTGHEGTIWQASWDADESRILTCGSDKTARIWDAKTGVLLHTLTGHAETVRQATWNKDSSQVLTCSDDGTARVWDAQTGKPLFSLDGHKGSCKQAAWNVNESRILTRGCETDSTGSDCTEGAVRIWDAQTGQSLTVLSSMGKFYQANWSKINANHLLTASDDGTARLWNAETGQALLTLTGHRGAVRQVIWNDAESQILTAGNDGTARVWDVAGNAILTLVGHADWVWQAEWIAGEKRILTIGNDYTVRIWEAETGQELIKFADDSAWWNANTNQLLTTSTNGAAHMWDVSAVLTTPVLMGELPILPTREDKINAAWNVSGTHILSWKNTVQVWDAQTGKSVLVLPENKSVILQANWNKDASRILMAGWDGTVQVWDAETSQALVAFNAGDICRATWNNLETQILTEIYEGESQVWDATTGKALFALPGHAGCISPAAWSTDDSWILAGDLSHTMQIWDAKTGTPLPIKLVGHEKLIRQAAWDTTDRRILTYSTDRTARVWDAASGTALFTVSHTHGIDLAAWSPDGSRWLTAGCDKVDDLGQCLQRTLRVYDANTGNELFVLSGHTDRIIQAVWNADGSRILTASADRTARVWDASAILSTSVSTALSTGKTRQALFILSGHTDEVSQATWNAAETMILTVSQDRTARVWDIGVPPVSAGGPVMLDALFTLVGRQGVLNAQWNADGNRILVVNSDSTVSQHYVQIQDLLRAACQRAPRNMTEEEWRRYFGSEPYRKTCEK